VKIILERNVFYFDGKFYRQKRGTAVGAKMAPTYGTLVLGYLEHMLCEQPLNSYGQEFASYIRQNWKRFLENISFKNNFHGFKNKFFRKAMLYNVSFIFQPNCYCRNFQIVRLMKLHFQIKMT
jgi:hypothetical protein